MKINNKYITVEPFLKTIKRRYIYSSIEGSEFFFLWGPPSLLSNGALSPGVKRPERESDHSSATSAEVKKIWIYSATPPYAFMA
jgi:hypothetical protein